MTCHAVVGRLLLFMALNAETHRMVNNPLGCRHTGNVAVTRRTRHVVPDMRCMIEADMRDRGEAVHSLPRNVLALSMIISDFLQFRPVMEVFMAFPTFVDIGNHCVRPLFHAFMTIHAVHLHFINVNRVRVLDRLDRCRSDVEELPHRRRK